MAMPHIIEERSNGVLTLRMQRPDKKNALTVAMYDQMRAAVEAANNDAEVGAIVVTGTADCFTAGNDLLDFQQRATAANPPPSSGLRMIETLMACDTPIVAAVNGLAIGIGTTMLLHCDFVYAGRSAVFRTPFVDLGLCPEAASSLLLPLVAGPRRAAEMLLAGDSMKADEALACGLVSRVFDDAETLPRALAQAERLAQKPRESVRLSKRLMRRFWAAAAAETLDYERDQFATRLKSEDAQAALASFFARSAR
ncbi:MAG TPA: enoyl-CoA hydratase-related protein [Gammaproteobacteria bacterium]|nr:enoyl-CoA hydratase-related protein [Gammaproteobacteria bacterium]